MLMEQSLQRIEKMKIEKYNIIFQSWYISRWISLQSTFQILFIEELLNNWNRKKKHYYTKIASMGYTGPPMAYICLDKINGKRHYNPEI